MIKFSSISLYCLILSLGYSACLTAMPTRELAERLKSAQESTALVANANANRNIPCCDTRAEPCTKKKVCYSFLGVGIVAAIITGIVYWAQSIPDPSCLKPSSNEQVTSDCWKVDVELCGPCAVAAASDWQPSFAKPTSAEQLVASVKNSIRPICGSFSEICIQTKTPQKQPLPGSTSCGSYTDFNSFKAQLNQTVSSCTTKPQNKVRSERFLRLKRIAQSKHKP